MQIFNPAGCKNVFLNGFLVQALYVFQPFWYLEF